MCVCAHTHVRHREHVESKQLAGAGSLSPSCGSQRSNSGCQAGLEATTLTLSHFTGPNLYIKW